MKKKYLSLKQKKKLLLSELEKSLGIVTSACKAANISRTTFYQYVKDDKDFADAVYEISEITLDYVESKILQNIKNGDKTSIIFYLKTKGKHRGYIEKQEYTVYQEVKNIDFVYEPLEIDAEDIKYIEIENEDKKDENKSK